MKDEVAKFYQNVIQTAIGETDSISPNGFRPITLYLTYAI